MNFVCTTTRTVLTCLQALPLPISIRTTVYFSTPFLWTKPFDVRFYPKIPKYIFLLLCASIHSSSDIYPFSHCTMMIKLSSEAPVFDREADVPRVAREDFVRFVRIQWCGGNQPTDHCHTSLIPDRSISAFLSNLYTLRCAVNGNEKFFSSSHVSNDIT